MLKIALVAALASAFAMPFCAAQEIAPDTLLKPVTAEVIGIIRQDKDIHAGNPAKVAELVETRILPYFDFGRIRQSGTAPLAMDYDMERLPAGWKVFDIKVDGMSLVTTCRETFADKVRESGVDGLINSLADKNRQDGARLRPDRTGEFYVPVVFQSVFQGLGH
jgi:ABC-type transporter MlaC component